MGRTVLLTGAGGLVGRGIAHVLAQHGANIYCCDRDRQRQDELVEALEHTTSARRASSRMSRSPLRSIASTLPSPGSILASMS